MSLSIFTITTTIIPKAKKGVDLQVPKKLHAPTKTTPITTNTITRPKMAKTMLLGKKTSP
jgi:hypothetical protein